MVCLLVFNAQPTSKMCQREIHCLQYWIEAAATGVVMLLSKIDGCGHWTLLYHFHFTGIDGMFSCENLSLRRDTWLFKKCGASSFLILSLFVLLKHQFYTKERFVQNLHTLIILSAFLCPDQCTVDSFATLWRSAACNECHTSIQVNTVGNDWWNINREIIIFEYLSTR